MSETKKRSGLFFSRNKFLDDYVIRDELNEKGRVVQRAYYAAQYFESVWTAEAHLKNKLMILCAGVLAIAGNVIPMATVHDAMVTMWLILGFVVGIIGAFYLMIAAFHLPKDKTPMKREDKYYSFEKLGLWAGVTMAADAYALLASLAFLIFKKPLLYPAMDAVTAVCAFVAALAAWFVLRLVRTADVHEIEKRPVVPEQADLTGGTNG